MTNSIFNLKLVHKSWHACIKRGLDAMNNNYLNELNQTSDWLPGTEKIFSAFSLPLNDVNYVLFGESPYPRRESANGYAFWDNAVTNLWSETGLDKKVNRATSLRNMLKMLLVADGLLINGQTTQQDIARLDKSALVHTNHDFFHNFIGHGFLLMNATPVLRADAKPQKDAKEWLPFLEIVLNELLEKRPNTTFLMLGKIANTIDGILADKGLNLFYAEHPYNISFINNPEVINFFQPLQLLRKHPN